jgi:hypothetical protein
LRGVQLVTSAIFCTHVGYKQALLVSHSGELTEAINMGESEDKPRFKCYVCGRKFDSRIGLIRHNLKLDK